MSDKTRVYLITGFLGAGKTTFLNRIINRFPKDKKLTVLMNEFGEIGIDGTLVEGEDIDMMEISKGSIFCVCVKTDFIKGLYELGATVKPDVLLIESTGVANPSDLKRDLQLPIFNGRFQYEDQFCVIDCAHFMDAFEVYASLEKQIASSTVFILNKTDIATPETIETVKGVVREYHPDPHFYETTYSDIPLEEFFHIRPEPEAEDGPPLQKLSDEELDKIVDDLLASPDVEITPPDRLMSVTYRWEGKELAQVRQMADSLPVQVVRAKGFVEEKGTIYLFSYVMGDWTVEKSDVPRERIHATNVVVFIAPPGSLQGIAEATKSGQWTSLGELQPFAGTA